jgi:hypothetical protein
MRRTVSNADQKHLREIGCSACGYQPGFALSALSEWSNA